MKYILIAFGIIFNSLLPPFVIFIHIYKYEYYVYTHVLNKSIYPHLSSCKKLELAIAFSSIHINIQPYPAWLKLFASWSPNSIYRFTPFKHIPSFGVEPRGISNKRSSETTHADFDAQIFLGLFAFWIDEVTWQKNIGAVKMWVFQ